MSKPRRLLVVEDDPNARDALAQILRDEGFELYAATNGRNALALAEECVFTAVIADLQMPEMNGLDLVLALRKREPHPSVIVMTVHETALVEQRARSLGAAAFLRKPIDVEQLMQCLRQACAR